jgi:hypothetical protein
MDMAHLHVTSSKIWSSDRTSPSMSPRRRQRPPRVQRRGTSATALCTGQVLTAHTSAMGRSMLADLRPDHVAPMLHKLAARDERCRRPRSAARSDPRVRLRAHRPSGRHHVLGADRPRRAAIYAAGGSTRTAQQGQKQTSLQLHAAAAPIRKRYAPQRQTNEDARPAGLPGGHHLCSPSSAYSETGVSKPREVVVPDEAVVER